MTRTSTFLPRIGFPFMILATLPATDPTTSTVEAWVPMRMAPSSRELTPHSPVIAPTRLAGRTPSSRPTLNANTTVSPPDARPPRTGPAELEGCFRSGRLTGDGSGSGSTAADVSLSA